jgi:hypothetical protein
VLTSVKHLETTSRGIFASTTTHESRKLNYFSSELKKLAVSAPTGKVSCSADANAKMIQNK